MMQSTRRKFLAVGAAATVTAGGGLAALGTGQASAAPTVAAASTTLTAVVDGTASNGAQLVRGSGALSASLVSGDLTRGTYQVVFDRNITQCAYSATIAGKATDVPNTGFVTVTGRGGNANAVFVVTRNADNSNGRNRFHVAVFC